MVYGVVGKLGGGKSFSCVRMMLENLRLGMGVVSNIRLKEDYLLSRGINASKYRYLEDFGGVNPWTLPHGDLRGSGGRYRVIIVIDEAGEWLDSYSDARHKGTQLSDVASWLRQSDKLGQDVYFIVQFESLLHTRLRSIVHRWLYCFDLAKFRLPIVGVGLPPGLRQFIVVSEYDGLSRERITMHWLPKSREVFEAYDTAAFFGGSFAASSSAQSLDFNGSDYSRVGAVPWFAILVGIMSCYGLVALAGLFFFWWPFW